MKFAMISKSVVLGLAVLLASSAFAATKASLHLNDATMVNGTKLKAGDYKLQWEGNGPSVDVSVMQGRNVLTKISAKVVDLDSAALSNAAVLRHNSDGTTALTGARFEGKKYAIEVTDTGEAMQAGSGK